MVIYEDITAADIGKIIGVSSRTVETHIRKLKESNLIERIGGRKEGYWQIKMQAR